MKRMSVHWKLTLLYVGTVSVLLAIFIGADVVGLKHNLMQQTSTHAISQEVMTATWLRAIWEHLLLAIGLIFIVFMFGSFFIRRLLKPISEMANTTEQITADDLSMRILVTDKQDEFGQLASVINGMISRLEDSFSRMKRFSADVAHELSTPLTVLRGEIEIALRRERSAESYKQSLTQLLREVDLLSTIVNDLLFLAQADAQSLTVPEYSINLDDAVMRAYETILPIAETLGINLKLNQLEETEISGDAQLLQRMIINLLSNAIKFSADGGLVEINLETINNKFILTIKDNGIGIPEEEQKHIFDRFYRVDKSRSKQTGGTGLGLAIVKEIAELHQFDIKIKSSLDKGTTVSVSQI